MTNTQSTGPRHPLRGTGHVSCLKSPLRSSTHASHKHTHHLHSLPIFRHDGTHSGYPVSSHLAASRDPTRNLSCHYSGGDHLGHLPSRPNRGGIRHSPSQACQCRHARHFRNGTPTPHTLPRLDFNNPAKLFTNLNYVTSLFAHPSKNESPTTHMIKRNRQS